MKKDTLMYLAGGAALWWVWNRHQKAAAAKAASVALLAAQSATPTSPLQTPVAQIVSP